MTNQQELKPWLERTAKERVDHIEMLAAAFVRKTGLQPDECELCQQTEGTLTKWWFRPKSGITRAEPAAPSSDDAEYAIQALEAYANGLGEGCAKTLRAHIAALEADNKRLREALQSGNNTYLGGQYIVCIKPEIVEAALAQTDGKVGEL